MNTIKHKKKVLSIALFRVRGLKYVLILPWTENKCRTSHKGAWITTKGGRYAPTIEILLRADHR